MHVLLTFQLEPKQPLPLPNLALHLTRERIGRFLLGETENLEHLRGNRIACNSYLRHPKFDEKPQISLLLTIILFRLQFSQAPAQQSIEC